MSSRFFISQKKWPEAVRRAISYLVLSRGSGHVSDIGFDLGPPSGGHLTFRITVDGKRSVLCRPGDTYPFLESLREWMERCLVFDKEGTLHPEILTLDCSDGVYSVIMFHAGWDRIDGLAEPISGLAVISSGRDEPTLCCFCRTRETISRLYRSIMDGIAENRYLFDKPGAWYDPGRFSPLDRRTTAERLIERICSDKLDLLLK